MKKWGNDSEEQDKTLESDPNETEVCKSPDTDSK